MDKNRIFHMDFLLLRQHHTIAFLAHHIHSFHNCSIFFLHLGQIPKLLHEIIFILKFHTGHLTEHLIIAALLHLHRIPDTTFAQNHLVKLHLADAGLFNRSMNGSYIPEYPKLFHHGSGSFHHLLLHRVRQRQHLHPAGHAILHLHQRKFQQHLLQDHIYIFLFQLLTINRNDRYLVFMIHIFCPVANLLAVWPGSVE